MRKANLILFLITFITHNASLAQGSWVKLTTPTTHNLKCVFFIDSLKGWVAGDSGIILFTTDGGYNWQTQNSTVNYSIHNIFFLDENNGWALCWRRNEFGPIGTTFLKTSNGGINWTAIDYEKDLVFFHSIFFQTLLNGWICGDPGKILKTTDGGLNWNEPRFLNIQFADFPIVKIKFFDNNYGLGCGGIRDIAGVIWITSDGGNSWNSFPIGPEPILDFQIIDTNFVIAVGGDYEYGTSVSTSFDKGINWIYRTLDIFGIANSVAFRNAKEGWLNLIGERKFLVTIDSGWTWNEYLAPDSVQPNQIVFVDSLHGYAACDSGFILKYIPPFLSDVNKNEGMKYRTNSIQLNVFPNPFNSEVKIQLNIPTPGRTELVLYDILGRKISTVFTGYLNSGEYKFYLNHQNLSAGIYLLHLLKDDVRTTKKIILTK